MIGYADKEMISSTELQKTLSQVINRLKKHELDKIAVLRNNKVETVMVSREEYEKIMDRLDFLEHAVLYATIQERKKTPSSEYESLDDVLKEAGIDKDDL